MAKLILSMDGLVLKEIPLTKERTTIGRKPHNDIQVDNLTISGDHAAIVTILKDSILEDLDSTNGTRVNSRDVKESALHHKDLIQLGSIEFLFDAPELASSGARYTDADAEVATGTMSAPQDFASISPFGAPPKERRGVWYFALFAVGIVALVALAFFLLMLAKAG